ncbi:GAF domain-containing protein [Actinoplanes sp. Pm04-4]|uniref:GAF domain-containing protein n=1 Tax=Paractinoplanes pyxinae TaxID=2997416 RepID=A0ABT4BCC1_9ACTN|nr:GAF domain-containing protein [Actinoplanes pyxinae]MCY1144173.1 GAF domain-containing protein [Actinoplanes pyxinae]
MAATPNGSFRIATDLIIVAQLAEKLITAVDWVSVTSRLGNRYVTAAVGSDLAAAVDQAQYDDGAGPCLEALEADYPAFVPDIAATVTWPRFRDTAASLGLKTSLSVPLFAGSGVTFASLNLYSRRAGTLSTLTNAVWAAYDPDPFDCWNHDALDPGGRELTAGLISAVALRAMIRRAAAILSAGRMDTHRGYLILCEQAAAAGTSLTDTAALVIEQNQPHLDA